MNWKNFNNAGTAEVPHKDTDFKGAHSYNYEKKEREKGRVGKCKYSLRFVYVDKQFCLFDFLLPKPVAHSGAGGVCLHGNHSVGRILEIETLQREGMWWFSPGKCKHLQTPLWIAENETSFIDGLCGEPHRPPTHTYTQFALLQVDRKNIALQLDSEIIWTSKQSPNGVFNKQWLLFGSVKKKGN